MKHFVEEWIGKSKQIDQEARVHTHEWRGKEKKTKVTTLIKST
jgi:hypothetical protein